MPRRSSTPLIITVIVIIALAVVVAFAGPPIWNALKSMHGGSPSPRQLRGTRLRRDGQ